MSPYYSVLQYIKLELLEEMSSVLLCHLSVEQIQFFLHWLLIEIPACPKKWKKQTTWTVSKTWRQINDGTWCLFNNGVVCRE